MPRLNINYQNTIIYKFVCNDINIFKEEYVGNTTHFINRKTNHKFNCNHPNSNKYHYKLYETIRNNGGWDNWKMVMIEEYPCNNSLEARKRERYYQEILNASLNMRKPQRDEIERRKDNHIELKEKSKIYREKNKELIKEKVKIYREKNKDLIKIQKKQEYERNKDKYKERNKINREKLIIKNPSA